MKRFSKAICLALLVFTMIFALAGCSTAPKQDLGDIVIAEPVAEPATETATEPVVEPSGESEVEPVIEAVKYVPVEKKYTLFTEGDITVVADKGKATITYPAQYITEDDIDAAALVAYEGFSSIYDLSEVYYEAEDGVLTIYYPESWGVEELAVAEKAVMDVLPAYVEAVLASATTAEIETSAEYAATISVYGFDFNIEAYENVIEITYPSFITYDEIKAAAEVAYEAYSDYLEGSVLYVDSANATAVLTLAATPSNEDLSYVVSVLDVALPAYIASLYPEAVEPLELSASISLFGYEASITLKDDIITIDYPDFISEDEVKAAAAAAYEAYSQYLEGSELTIDDGYSTLKLAFKINEEEFDYAVDLLQSELSYYVAYVLGVTEETVEEVPEVLESAITFLGQNVSIVAEGNTITITYPAVITNAEVATVARAAYEAYSQYLDGSALTIDNGTAVLTLAYDLTSDDFNYALGLLQGELDSYVASVTETTVDEVVETVTEVAEAISEAVTSTTEETPAEQPAEEKPVETKTETETKPAETKTETTKPAETKTETTTTTATAEPAKKSNAGLIVLIIVLVVVAAAAVVLFLKKKKN